VQLGQGSELARRVDHRLAVLGYFANGVGGVVLMLFAGFFVPGTVDSSDYVRVAVLNIGVGAAYLAVGLPAGRALIERREFAPIAAWLTSGQPATSADQLRALRLPRQWALLSTVPWIVGTLLITGVNLTVSKQFAASIATVALLGGATACALQYLLVERTIRPVVAVALAGGPPPPTAVPGVRSRIAMAWTIGAAMPLLGIGGMAISALLGHTMTRNWLAGACVVLVVIGLAVGLTAMRLTSRSLGEPLVRLRDALEDVERGNLTTAVEVDDGSEVGLVQAGFNRMVEGLRDRERLHEALGTYVHPAITDRILDEGVNVAGEELEVSIMFVDVRDFTAFAERAPATQVVTRLNELFELAVPIVDEHHGHVNKFIGDGLLAVFGAPERRPDHAECAVASACAITEAVRRSFDDTMRVGVGVNTGPVVVGTVGGGGHLDFTVIGDAVNTAARVEAATRRTGDDVLITESTLSRLTSDTSAWVRRDPLTLKGKEQHIHLYGLADATPSRRTGGAASSAGTRP
jgi:adenylate cyclase